MKFIVYGSFNIDKVFYVDHLTAPGETQMSLSMEIDAGGKGANQAAAMAKAGSAVFMAGKIGPDGLWLKDMLAELGCDVTYVSEDASYTGEAIIQVDRNAQNSIFLFSGGNGENTPDEMEQILSHFCPGDWVICQNEISNMASLITIAHSKGLKVCLNPSPYDDVIETLPLDLVNLVMVNEIEARKMARTGSTDFSEILEALTRRFPELEIIMTVGSEGSYYAHGAERHFAPAFKVNAHDTTAAGDTYTGYYMAARYSDGMDIESAMRTASKASSITVSRHGAIVAIPTRSEVL